MKRVLTVVGTRPEVIKMAPVIARINESDDLESIVLASGQHDQMLEQFTRQFGITVDINLKVMQHDQTLGVMTSRLMTELDAALAKTRPDVTLVQGDTTTVFVTALASFYRGIPVGHVEAGMRTGNIRSPFPEEVNRRFVSTIASIHFAPTDSCRRNLLHEGVREDDIVVTGNTVIDSLLKEGERQSLPEVHEQTHSLMSKEIGEDWCTRPFVLITGHRRENFGDGFVQICEALRILASRFPHYRFVYPVHLNPNVRAPVYTRLGSLSNVCLIEPQGYSTFVALMRHCRIILTDSGGVQEEAPSLGKPVVVMRDTTERPEGVEAGTAILTGANSGPIVETVSSLLVDNARYLKMCMAHNPYGDGSASRKIVDCVREFLENRNVSVNKSSPLVS